MRPALRALVGVGLLGTGAAGAEVAPLALSAVQQAVRPPCVTAVSTGGSPYRVIDPEGAQVSSHAQLHTAQASAVNAGFSRPGETHRIQQVLEIRVTVNPECVPAVEPPPPSPLPPDSFVVLRDTIELQVGETVQLPLVGWWTIPQEAQRGSRPFVCFGGDFGLPFPALGMEQGWHEIAFPDGYPASTRWVLAPDGHTFTGGPCLVGEVTADSLGRSL